MWLCVGRVRPILKYDKLQVTRDDAMLTVMGAQLGQGLLNEAFWNRRGTVTIENKDVQVLYRNVIGCIQLFNQ